jgi:uncharacterized Zn finger protein
MAARQTCCPECGSPFVDTVVIHNPETLDMNARATLRCCKCGHQWEGRITSPHHERKRAKGRSI